MRGAADSASAFMLFRCDTSTQPVLFCKSEPSTSSLAIAACTAGLLPLTGCNLSPGFAGTARFAKQPFSPVPRPNQHWVWHRTALAPVSQRVADSRCHSLLRVNGMAFDPARPPTTELQRANTPTPWECKLRSHSGRSLCRMCPVKAVPDRQVTNSHPGVSAKCSGSVCPDRPCVT